MQENQIQFYLVWNGHSQPTVRHQSHASAAAEADRLAQRYPGASFYVLKCTEYRIAEIVPQHYEVRTVSLQPGASRP